MHFTKKALLPIFFILLTVFIAWKTIFYANNAILSFSYWLDDWPLIWGVSQQKSVFFNPNKTFWKYEDERFTVREGFIQIWAASFLFQNYGLNPYWYHLYGLLAKLLASTAILYTTYKLTNKLYIGIVASLIFASSAMGMESLYWFNVNSVYILIAIATLALPFFINGLEGNKRSFIISLIISALGIFLYTPRSHVFLAFPALVFIWSLNFFKSKQFWLKLVITLVVIFLAYKLPTAGGAEGQAYNAIIHRLIVFSGDGLNAGNHIFFTYPFVAIPLSIFPPEFLQALASFPKEPIFKIPENLGKASFYTWNLIIFPTIWMSILGVIYFIKNKLGEKNQMSHFILFSGLGGGFIIINELLRRFIFAGRFWDFPTHFLFTISVFLIFIPFTLLFFFRNDLLVKKLAKLLISLLILIEISYILNWAFDPLIHPASLSISRYLTLPTAFGSMYFAILVGVILVMAERFYILFRKNNTLKSRVFSQPAILGLMLIVGFLVFQSINSNSKFVKTHVENTLLPIRSHKGVSNILGTITENIKKGPQPALVLLDSWDYAEVFAILIYSGHSLAVWGSITNPNEFPLIYYDVKKLATEFPNLCKKYPNLTKENFYRFIVKPDQAINVSEKFPEDLDCKSLMKLAP